MCRTPRTCTSTVTAIPMPNLSIWLLSFGKQKFMLESESNLQLITVVELKRQVPNVQAGFERLPKGGE